MTIAGSAGANSVNASRMTMGIGITHENGGGRDAIIGENVGRLFEVGSNVFDGKTAMSNCARR